MSTQRLMELEAYADQLQAQYDKVPSEHLAWRLKTAYTRAENLRDRLFAGKAGVR